MWCQILKLMNCDYDKFYYKEYVYGFAMKLLLIHYIKISCSIYRIFFPFSVSLHLGYSLKINCRNCSGTTVTRLSNLTILDPDIYQPSKLPELWFTLYDVSFLLKSYFGRLVFDKQQHRLIKSMRGWVTHWRNFSKY